MQLNINEDYRITTDKLNIMLEKSRVVKDKDSKNHGETVWDTVGFYPSLDWALKACISHGIMANDLIGVEAVNNYLNRIYNDITAMCEGIENNHKVAS